MIYQEAVPNITHIKLAELESNGTLRGIITQNIDGLHQKAGSKNVLELHGSIHRNYCMNCNKFYDIDEIINQKGIVHCSCEGIMKPDVVLYGESLNEEVMDEAVKLINQAEVLLIGGTSLSVYPAAGLIRYYQGDKLALINKDITPYDENADLLINTKLGDVFSSLN
jgi:NAD-dependent deacetylase